MVESDISRSGINSFHKRLHAWYKDYGRCSLPWRTTRDPYAIWVSEVMLQQTQVRTVLERYYFPFLECLPTVTVLAQAPVEQVLKAWEGLGYYTRARNLHEAAKICAEQYEGELPKTVEALEALPGIGKNTAHAVASFAYGDPVPVLEANVKRVVARIFAQKDGYSPKSEKELWKKAFLLLEKNDPFTYNQAMMDVGSLVCTPKNPNCVQCPANLICLGKGAPESYYERPLKKKVLVRKAAVQLYINKRNGKMQLALETRNGKFLGGLFGFPITEGDGNFPESGKNLGNVRHIYTHFIREADVFLIETRKLPEGLQWYSLDEIGGLALSKLDHKILNLFNSSR